MSAGDRSFNCLPILLMDLSKLHLSQASPVSPSSSLIIFTATTEGLCGLSIYVNQTGQGGKELPLSFWSYYSVTAWCSLEKLCNES